MYDDYLQHYGIKGMRWGHRKNRTRAQPEQSKKSVGERFKEEFNKTTWKQKIGVMALSSVSSTTTRMLLSKYSNYSVESVNAASNMIAIGVDMAGMNAAKKYNEIHKQRR